MSTYKICMLGGTGFVGQHLAARLNELQIPVKILTRRREKHRPILVLPLAEVIEADIYDIKELRAQFSDCNVVINLVGILNERGHTGHGFRKAHVELPRTLLDACKKTSVRRLLHMSALHADAGKGPSIYLRTKGEAEDYLHTFHGDVSITSFRTSVIFGPGDSFFNRFAGLLKLIPFVFPLACPNSRFAPAYVGDIVERFIAALDDPGTYGKRIDLCGPEVFTLKELVEYTARKLHLRRKIIGLPDWLALSQAFFMDYFVPGKPFSLDNYHSLKIDNVSPTAIKLPTGIDSIVPFYLGKQHQRHRFDEFRQAHRE